MDIIVFFSTVGIIALAYSIWTLLTMKQSKTKKQETPKQQLEKSLENLDLAGKNIEEVKQMLGKPTYMAKLGGNPAIYYWIPPDYLIEITFNQDGKFLKLLNYNDKNLLDISKNES